MNLLEALQADYPDCSGRTLRSWIKWGRVAFDGTPITHANTPLTVHRIDQDTSGTLLFARGTLSEEKFDPLFERHAIEREYIAIVEGRIPQDSGTWESYLCEKENYDVEVTTPEEGKKAIAHFEVIRRSKKFNFLRLRLETGRKHQIRVHCMEAGYPVMGDRRYGSLVKHRLCLHAHPFTGKKIEVEAPIPFKKFGSFSR